MQDLLLVIDIDGTVNTMGQKFDLAKVDTVSPMKMAMDFLTWFSRLGGKVVYLTGRSKELGEITRKWLFRHGFPDVDDLILYSPERYGPWTWDSYVRFKEQEITTLRHRFPDRSPVVIDDNDAILAMARKSGVPGFKIRDHGDWMTLFNRFARERGISRLAG